MESEGSATLPVQWSCHRHVVARLAHAALAARPSNAKKACGQLDGPNEPYAIPVDRQHLPGIGTSEAIIGRKMGLV